MSAATIDDQAGVLAERLLSESREELVRADAKAATLFGVFAIAFGVVLAGVIAGDWAPSELADSAEVVWWIGAASAALAVAAVSAAVWPRLDSESATGRVTYFGHVVAYRTRDSLVEALERQATHDLDRPVEQLEAISAIVMEKYVWIQRALVLFGFGAVACGLAVFVS
jgi:hypothetical protein